MVGGDAKNKSHISHLLYEQIYYSSVVFVIIETLEMKEVNYFKKEDSIHSSEIFTEVQFCNILFLLISLCLPFQ